ncbi:hypothetical protein Tco_0557356 [Tanacetum coccineum]
MTLLLCSVTVPPSTGNFNHSGRPNGLSAESDKVSGGRNHLIPYLLAELYEAMLIQDFRRCSTVNIYPMHKVSAALFDFDDHRFSSSPSFFTSRLGKTFLSPERSSGKILWLGTLSPGGSSDIVKGLFQPYIFPISPLEDSPSLLIECDVSPPDL